MQLITQELERRKGDVAAALAQMTDVMREVSARQDEAAPMIGQVALLLDTARDTLDRHTVQDATDAVADLARRNPAMFAASCLLIGIAFGRFLTASDPSNRDHSEASSNDTEGYGVSLPEYGAGGVDEPE